MERVGEDSGHKQMITRIKLYQTTSTHSISAVRWPTVVGIPVEKGRLWSADLQEQFSGNVPQVWENLSVEQVVWVGGGHLHLVCTCPALGPTC